MHVGSIYDNNVHVGSIYDNNLHVGSIYDNNLHVDSISDSNVHVASTYNNSVLPQRGVGMYVNIVCTPILHNSTTQQYWQSITINTTCKIIIAQCIQETPLKIEERWAIAEFVAS